MGPKKQKQLEWNECQKCKRVVHRKDAVNHKDSCSALHGFIQDNVLHGLVCAPTAQTEDALSKFPLMNQDSIVLVNTCVMTLCNLAIAQPCLVNGHHVLTLWPCDIIPPASILLPSLITELITQLKTTENVIVTVEQFIPSGLLAHRVEIELEWANEVFFTEEFLQILSCKMEGKHIAQGIKYAVRYFGLKCVFGIKTIQCLPYTLQKLNTTEKASLSAPGNSEELCQSFTSLNISNISDQGDHLNTSLSVTPLELSNTDGSQSVTASELSFAADDLQSVKPSKLSSMESSLSSVFYNSESAESKLSSQADNNKSFSPEQFSTPHISRRKGGNMVDSARFVEIVAHTEFVISQRCSGEQQTVLDKEKVTFDSLGGLDTQIQSIRMHCEQILQRTKHKSPPAPWLPHGILLFGPSGTGKSMLAQATANELGIFTTHLSPADLYSKFLGETEKKLRKIFEVSRKRSPSLLIIDNIDALCPGKDSNQSELERRTLNTFFALMDDVANASSKEVCIIIGITSKADHLGIEWRRFGRFDVTIELGVPSAADRFQILKMLLQNVPHSMSDSDLKSIADVAHGYVGADLASLVCKARQSCQERTQDKELTAEELRIAASQVKPSAMKEVQFEVPEVRWSDIGGQKEVKLKLQQAVEWPLKHPEAFSRMGIDPPCGCLMYGPPGCSKTMIAKALATESGLNFLAVKGPELFGKYVGESERAVREIFRKARSAAPSIIFFDEIDSLAVERGRSSGGSNVADRVLTQLLTEMDGVVQLKGVTIVAATNRPDMIDKALLRPGRFDHILYVPLPDPPTRKEILQIIGRKMPFAPEISLDDLVNRTERYSGAELTALCQEAGLCALTENREAKTVQLHHFEAALKTRLPQTSQDMIKFYEDYSTQNGFQIS